MSGVARSAIAAEFREARRKADEAAAEMKRRAECFDELVAALKEMRRAIGDHNAPNDCYATGPLTGDAYRDLVQCPACSALAAYEQAIRKAGA